MRRFLLLLALSFAIALCGSSGAAVLVLFPDGHYVSKPNLAAANTAADVAGAKVVVTGPETVPSDFVWRSDAKLVVEKGGSIAVKGGSTIIGPFETGPTKIVAGGANITKQLPPAIGNPPAAWTSRVDTVTSGTGDNLGFVSQITSGMDTPPTGSSRVSQNLVAGYFAGYNGAHSAAFHTVLNPILMLMPSDNGTVDVNGTVVTWVSGAPFQNSWVGGVLTINGALYDIASVSDSHHLTLQESAGVQSGATYYAGMGNAVEVDVNNQDVDATNYSLHGSNGIVIAGSPKRCRTGLAVNGNWVNGVQVNGFSDYGIYVALPLTATANGALITNGRAGSSSISGGNPVLILTGSSTALLRITPSDDADGAVMFGTNAANNAVNWSISKIGHAVFNHDVTTPAIQSTPTATSITLVSVPTYTSNNSAVAAGLTAGMIYRNGDVLQIVH